MPHSIDLGLGLTSLPVLQSAGGFPLLTDYHWDASNEDSYTLDTGRVDSWGESVQLTQGTASQRPVIATAELNGLDVMRFSKATSEYMRGTSTFIPAPSLTLWSLFALFKLRTVGTAAQEGILSAVHSVSTPGGNDWQAPNAFYIFDGTDHTAGTVLSTQGFTAAGGVRSSDLRGAFHLVEFHVRPSLNEMYVDGNLTQSKVATNANFLPDTFAMAGRLLTGSVSLFSDLDMAECAMIPTELSNDSINAARSYLMNKWLPASPFAWLP